jgi:hypothetical protein
MTSARWRNFVHQPRAFIARLDPTTTIRGNEESGTAGQYPGDELLIVLRGLLVSSVVAIRQNPNRACNAGEERDA